MTEVMGIIIGVALSGINLGMQFLVYSEMREQRRTLNEHETRLSRLEGARA